MNKEKLKEKLLQMEYKDVTEAQMNYETFISESMIHQNEVIDLDDSSHHWEDTDTSNTLDKQIHAHTNHLKVLKETSFAPTNEVKPGAIVKINNVYFIVVNPIPKFDFEGNSFMGISTTAPIYDVIKGVKKGAVCVFNGIEFKIQEVL